MRIVNHILSVVAFLALNIPMAYGCSCATPNVADAFNSAKVVLAGKVIAVKNRRAKFKVERSWKGVSTSRITLIMGGSVFLRKGKPYMVAARTSCDYDFELGEKYLVYADGDNGYIRAWVCSRTQGSAKADEDLKEFEVEKLISAI